MDGELIIRSDRSMEHSAFSQAALTPCIPLKPGAEIEICQMKQWATATKTEHSSQMTMDANTGSVMYSNTATLAHMGPREAQRYYVRPIRYDHGSRTELPWPKNLHPESWSEDPIAEIQCPGLGSKIQRKQYLLQGGSARTHARHGAISRLRGGLPKGELTPPNLRSDKSYC